jgi:Virulence-associated protein E/Bifunctional DNA primase/polymerase, N-terminal
MTATTSAAYGAAPSDWAHLADHLGLQADLLPVVSNPNATVSPKSKMKDIGKTPSRYNGDRHVVGIPQWTDNQTTDRDIARYQRDSDLGICIQTREVRAIDVDIGDPALAAKVRDAIELNVGALPARCRGNSSKFLLAFRMPGPFTKRIIRTEQGAIEFLANGQQFIAIGTHPSGSRYEWEGGLPDEIPYLSRDEFEALWQSLQDVYGISASIARGPGARPKVARDSADVDDDVLTFLERTGWVKSFDSQGRAHIACPWEDEHTSDSAESATSYFPAGVGGFEQGHFRCLHAHCEHRTDGDFIEAVGYVTEDFAVIEPKPGDTELPLLLPAFERNRQGEILSTVGNLQLALRRADVCDVHVGYDAFNDELMLAPWKTTDWRNFTDADYVRLRVRLEAGGFKPIGRELIRDVVGLVADDNKFDSAQLWLERLEWDGVPRIEEFWTKYFNTEHSDYAKSCGLYIWTAMAGRVIQPGVKADMVPILVGDQGVGKSTGVAAMVMDPNHFMEVKLDDNEVEMARRMRGKLIGEIGELRGLHSREIEHVKAFVTRTHEEWVPKYKEFSTKFPRRLVFIGTTNNDEFLADETGNRRWLPLRVRDVDLAGIKADLLQLWAEGAARFREGGVQFREAQQLAGAVHAEHTISDPWEEAIRHWLAEDSFGTDGVGIKQGQTLFKITSLMQGALGMNVQQLARKDELRVGRILRGLGYEKTRVRDSGHQIKVWGTAQNCKSGQVAFNNPAEGLA